MSFERFFEALTHDCAEAFGSRTKGLHKTELQSLYEHAAARASDGPLSDCHRKAPPGADYAAECYVDLVMEGGGILGVSLLGYIYALEAMGIRFLSLGGASAGSITALLTAAAGSPDTRKGPLLLDMIGNMPLKSFIDGDGDARDYVFSLAKGMSPFSAKGIWKALQIRDNIKKDMGLCPGSQFEAWVSEQLDLFSCPTMHDVQQRMNDIPVEIAQALNLAPGENAGELALVAADVTTQSRLVFPKHASLFTFDTPHRHVNPARFVRASMSIPFVFTPSQFHTSDTPESRKEWENITALPPECFEGETCLPDICTLVDGGVVSNFPIDMFHIPGVPSCPTFGVKLQTEALATPVDHFGGLLAGTADTARRILDREFIRKNQDYRQLVTYIDTDHHHWLNFELSDKDKLDLVVRGIKAGFRFIAGFDWKEYKGIRQEIAASTMESGDFRHTRSHA